MHVQISLQAIGPAHHGALISSTSGPKLLACLLSMDVHVSANNILVVQYNAQMCNAAG